MTRLTPGSALDDGIRPARLPVLEKGPQGADRPRTRNAATHGGTNLRRHSCLGSHLWDPSPPRHETDGPSITNALQTISQDDDGRARMHDADVGKVNALVAAGREGLAHELAEAYRGTAGAAAPRPPAAWKQRTRESLRRFDLYTLEGFNPGSPYGPQTSRSH